MIVAHTNNRAIGVNNTLPWKCPADMAFFVKISKQYKHLLMGRVTASGLPSLKNRTVYVMSRKSHADFCNIEEVRIFDKKTPLLVCGGAQLYKSSIELVDTLYVTQLSIDIEGADTFFPEYEDTFTKIETIEEGVSNGIPYSIQKWKRK